MCCVLDGFIMNLKLNVLLFLRIGMAVSVSLDNELILGVLNEFQMNHPTMYHANISASTNLLMRNLSMNGQYCSIHLHGNSSTQSQNILVIAEEYEDAINTFEEVRGYSETFVILARQSIMQDVLNTMKVDINQKVFIVDQSTHDSYEVYAINNHQIMRKLGKFHHRTKDFIWENGIERNLITRRSNFHGLSLKVMTEASGNNLLLEPNWKDQAKFFDSNQTYLVTKFTSGSFHDVLIAMQKELNFTAELYKRKDSGWGQVYPQKDGSFHASGMVGDVFFGRADVIASTLTVTIKRSLSIDYLNPIAPDVVGLFIPSGISKGKFEFGILFHPLR